MSKPALLMPDGYTASAWPLLDEISRAMLLEEYLAAHSRFYVDGDVNYENSREPLLTDRVGGGFVTLMNEVVQPVGGPLELNIFGSQVQPNKTAVWAAIFILLGVMVIA